MSKVGKPLTRSGLGAKRGLSWGPQHVAAESMFGKRDLMISGRRQRAGAVCAPRPGWTKGGFTLWALEVGCHASPPKLSSAAGKPSIGSPSPSQQVQQPALLIGSPGSRNSFITQLPHSSLGRGNNHQGLRGQPSTRGATARTFASKPGSDHPHFLLREASATLPGAAPLQPTLLDSLLSCPHCPLLAGRHLPRAPRASPDSPDTLPDPCLSSSSSSHSPANSCLPKSTRDIAPVSQTPDISANSENAFPELSASNLQCEERRCVLFISTRSRGRCVHSGAARPRLSEENNSHLVTLGASNPN